MSFMFIHHVIILVKFYCRYNLTLYGTKRWDFKVIFDDTFVRIKCMLIILRIP